MDKFTELTIDEKLLGIRSFVESRSEAIENSDPGTLLWAIGKLNSARCTVENGTPFFDPDNLWCARDQIIDVLYYLCVRFVIE